MRSSHVLAAVLASSLGAAAAHGKPGAPVTAPAWKLLPAVAALPDGEVRGEVTVDGAAIRYASWGQGDAIVLLHGGMGNGEHWAGEITALAAHHRVIAIDARGHGRSERGTGPLSYHHMAEDVIAVLDGLKLERAAIVGWSDGGIIGLDLAIHHGDRLRALFAFGANYDLTGMKSSSADTITGYFARCKADYLRLSPEPKRLDKFRAELSAMWRHEPTFSKAELKAIAVPTAIADGEHDEIIRRAHAEQMARLIPGAQLVILPGLSHFAPWQDPDGFARAVLAFVDGADPAAR
jgi:pimeloyl-ACP methyl ester carboxylesterase